MRQPKFSVIVPTRNRPVTLRACLRACTALRYDSCEILVSDNSSTPETRQVVDEVSDPRVRYVRTNYPLSMHESWNFAIGQAAGDYLTVVGDDDALMPSSLAVLDRVISETGAKAVRWPQVHYLWPKTKLGVTDLLNLPGRARARAFHLTFHEGPAVLREVLRLDRPYNELPMIYNSALHRSVLDEMAAGTEKPFRSISPDIYSGIMAALIVPRFVSLHTAIGIVGQSEYSNGADTIVSICGSNAELPKANEFYALADAAGVHYHPEVPVAPSLNGATFETFLTIRDQNPALAASYSLDRKSIMTGIYVDLMLGGKSPDHVEAVLDQLRRRATPVLGRRRVARLEARARARLHAYAGEPEGIFGDGCSVRASALGVYDVADAAQVSEHLLGIAPERFICREFRPSVRSQIVPLVPEIVRRQLRRARRWLRTA